MENADVTLHPLEGGPDVDLLASWLAQPRVWEYLGPPHVDGRFNANFIRLALRSGRVKFYMIHAGARTVGLIGFSEICSYSKKADFFGLLGETDLSLKGVMLKATGLAIEKGFTELGLHSMYSRVMQDNLPIIKGLLAHGFNRYGVQREAFFLRGRFVDIHHFERLRSEWEKSRC